MTLVVKNKVPVENLLIYISQTRQILVASLSVNHKASKKVTFNVSLFLWFTCLQSMNPQHSNAPMEPCGSSPHEGSLSTSISIARQPCVRMFSLPSFIKPALCFSLIISGRAEHPDKRYQHPSM